MPQTQAVAPALQRGVYTRAAGARRKARTFFAIDSRGRVVAGITRAKLDEGLVVGALWAVLDRRDPQATRTAIGAHMRAEVCHA